MTASASPDLHATAAPSVSLDEAYRECERYARRHSENFSVVTFLLPRRLRPHFFAVYAFCRFTDDLGDEAEGDRIAMLDAWELELREAVSGDFRAASPEIRARIAAAAEVELLSNFGEDAAWQLEVVRRGEEHPGGGLLMFDIDPARRLVAMYGHPASSGLGVLGEQGAAAGVERLKQIVVGYGEDGARVVPTFEIITTVASAHPGPDGDYSSETARDVIRPWIEIAAANEMYVVLDLQPGRTDFLTQAKIYEEFLRLPHVGLALDPEWRLKPHQVHMRQVGTVDAAEINQVSEWLAALVRREALPQKLVVLHQFEWKMITNRHLIETPPELAVLIHMDGFGTQGVKQSTWNVLTAAPDADKFWWGWKNFYDEDTPTARPDRVLGLTPPALFVSYQ